MPMKFLVLGGGFGRGKCCFYFMGAGDFSDSGESLTVPSAQHPSLGDDRDLEVSLSGGGLRCGSILALSCLLSG